MTKPIAALIAVFSIFFSTALVAQTPAVEEPETVLVTGEQPGPGLWKVSKDDHVMWILGTHGPLPRNMSWRSKNVESLIAQSQEVLYAGRVRVGTDIGMFKAMTLLPSMIKASKNPNDAGLEDLLPSETYAKCRTPTLPTRTSG